MRKLNEKYYRPYKAILGRAPKGRKGYQGRVERSHRTDDEEFYIPMLASINNEKEFLCYAGKWIYWYNVKRPHFGKGMGKPPFEKLRELRYDLPEEFACFPPKSWMMSLLFGRLGVVTISWPLTVFGVVWKVFERIMVGVLGFAIEVYLRHLRPKVRTKRAIINAPVNASIPAANLLHFDKGRESPYPNVVKVTVLKYKQLQKSFQGTLVNLVGGVWVGELCLFRTDFL